MLRKKDFLQAYGQDNNLPKDPRLEKIISKGKNYDIELFHNANLVNSLLNMKLPDVNGNAQKKFGETIQWILASQKDAQMSKD